MLSPELLPKAAQKHVEGTMNSRVDAVIVAVYCAGTVLLVRNVSDAQWGFPGGMLHVGEKHGIGAKRKVREETGIDISAARLEALDMMPRSRDHNLHFFGVKLPPSAFTDLGTVGPCGHMLRQCPLEELGSIELRPAHKRFLMRMAARVAERTT